ncbi:uncharacterized protein LOC122499400 [Leptopilina heterotoma]|uniref:uncharacterized protein LOC122499400 n=1 Tax=Leptopilina heterotoma TaxID=63436 RepID=UPI001CA7C4A1|nr:uncharacterized protein LOC122499400 [Leptopilina heterotoma]
MPKEKSTRRVKIHRALNKIRNVHDLMQNDGNDADNEEESEKSSQRETESSQELEATNSFNSSAENESENPVEENENVYGNNVYYENENSGSDESMVVSAPSESEESNLYLSDTEDEYIDEMIEVAEDPPQEIEDLRLMAVTEGMEQKTVDKMLKILRLRLLPELPKSAKTFLGTSSANYDIKEMLDSDGSNGEFVYFGIEEGLKKCIDPQVHKKTTIFIQFNVDGISVFKSAEKGFWVLSGKVHYQPDIYKPFPVQIYAGNSKPNVDAYFDEFIAEINKLQKNSILIANQRFNVKIHCFICDTPARAFIKGTKGHTGFYCCERCKIKGQKVDGVTQFPLINSEERTDSCFRRQSQRRHHNYISPLLKIKPSVNMILMFVLDYMHLLCEGIMRRLMFSWFIISGRAKVGQNLKNEVSRRLVLIKKCIPCEFQRKTRSLKALSKWKATEFRFFLLYCGPIVLIRILNQDRYNNFLLLHTASRILCSDNLLKNYQQHAKVYLQHFFVELRRLYTKMQVLNMHCSIHVADDVLSMGCNLNKISAFPFENFLGKLTSLLRTPHRPLAQICRRVHELQSIDPPKPQKPYKIQILKSVDTEILKLRYKEYTLTTESPDNVVLLKDGSIFEIKCINKINEGMEIQGNIWKIKESLFMYPTDSKDLHIFQLDSRSNQLSTFDINFVKTKMVKIEINLNKNGPMKFYCIPLLH